MIKEERENAERLMAIYSKEDLIQIKNGNIQPVLQFNAITRPNSASQRVLLRETDPLNNLKRKFYRNSNKPLGNKHFDDDMFSKRAVTTIKELNSDLKEKGMLSAEKARKEKEFVIGDKDNSMLKSDIDIDEVVANEEEDENVIMELEEEDGET